MGSLAAVMAVSALFAATPFVIPAVALEYDVSIGRSGLLSAAQVAGFALAAFLAGRLLRTHRAYLIGGALGAAAFNLGSAFAPTFEILLVLRILTGAAAGLLVWLAWSKAMQSSGALRNVASAGPLTIFAAAPILAYAAAKGGPSAVYLLLALVSLPAALLPADFVGYRRKRLGVSPSRSNLVLLGALGVFTLAGSSLFVFGGAIGVGVGLSTFVVSLGFSGNALAGLIAARRTARDQPEGVWILGTAVCAALVAFGGNAVLFLVGITLWGFFFWMATPTILRSIAAWSLAPDERVGDAQSSMALGRALGPVIGSILVADGSYGAVGAVAVIGLALSASTIFGVRIYRRDRVCPHERGV
ncbi:MAG TPA: MFS transporter [Gemmatimonadetes bacterium]|nr:MFS transporter [Gemmatimonadota bacterium]